LGGSEGEKINGEEETAEGEGEREPDEAQTKKGLIRQSARKISRNGEMENQKRDNEEGGKGRK